MQSSAGPSCNFATVPAAGSAQSAVTGALVAGASLFVVLTSAGTCAYVICFSRSVLDAEVCIDSLNWCSNLPGQYFCLTSTTVWGICTAVQALPGQYDAAFVRTPCYASTCLPCPAGTLCPSTGTTVPTPCPSGYVRHLDADWWWSAVCTCRSSFDASNATSHSFTRMLCLWL